MSDPSQSAIASGEDPALLSDSPAVLTIGVELHGEKRRIGPAQSAISSGEDCALMSDGPASQTVSEELDEEKQL